MIHVRSWGRHGAALLLVCSAAVIPIQALSARPAAASTSITPGSAVGVAAGDYLLTATISATATSIARVNQLLNGTGTTRRNGTFSATTTASSIAAEVRVTTSNDVFNVVDDTATVTVADMELTSTTWGDVVRGTSITSATKSNVVLHGINNPYGTSGSMAPGDYDTLLAAYPSMTIVRVLIPEACWETFFTTLQASAFCNAWNGGGLTEAAATQAYFESIINEIVSDGDVALVGVIYSGDDDATFSDSHQLQFLPDQHTLDVYSDLATLYGNNAQVMFETTNEPEVRKSDPYPGETPELTGAELWLNGGTITHAGETWDAPGVQQIVDAIRGTTNGSGSTITNDNVIMVEGLDGGTTDLTPVETTPVFGTNLVYSYHVYPTSNSCLTPSYFSTQIEPLGEDYGYATFMSEFGTTQPDSDPPYIECGTQYENNVIGAAEDLNSGWTVWGWYEPGDGYALLTTSSYTSGFTHKADTILVDL